MYVESQERTDFRRFVIPSSFRYPENVEVWFFGPGIVCLAFFILDANVTAEYLLNILRIRISIRPFSMLP